MSPYPQATVTIPADGATVYGWNEEATIHIRIEGECSDAVRAVVQQALNELEDDRHGQQWARAMLAKLPEVRASARAYREANPK